MSIALRSKPAVAPKRNPKAKFDAKPKLTRRRKTVSTFDWQNVVIHFGPLKHKITDEEYFKFCAQNKNFRFEMSKEGVVMVMTPTGGEGGNRSFKLTARLGFWVEADGTGEGFDSSTEFILPNGAKRMPDFSWVRRERWEKLTNKQREQFPPICPDFVVELRSRTDRLNSLKKKMEEYMENGARLGWVIDPLKKKVYIYRPNADVEILDKPKTLSGEQVLKGLKLDLKGILD